MFDLLGEISSGLPWFYRVWACIFFKTYRKKLKAEYLKMSVLIMGVDILLSLSFFILEIWGILYLIYWGISIAA